MAGRPARQASQSDQLNDASLGLFARRGRIDCQVRLNLLGESKMVAQHSSRYFSFSMAFMVAMIALGLGEVRVSIAGFDAHSLAPEPAEPRCPSDSPPGVIHALLIGVGQYPVLPEHLQLGDGPANDLALLSRTLVNKGAKPENIKILLDSQATVEGILNALDDLYEKIPCGDQILIHFSGHAIENALVTFNVRKEPNGEEDGIITGNMLREKIEKIVNFKKIPISVFIDANYAESLEMRSLVGERGKFGERVNIAIFHPISGVIQVRLPSEMHDRKPYGLFSWCLAKSLTEIPGSVKVSELANNMNRCLTSNFFMPLSFAATNWDMMLNFPGVISNTDSTSIPSNTDSTLIEFTNLPPEQRGFRLSEQLRLP